MLKREDLWLAIYLMIAYIVVADLLSLATSHLPLCIVNSADYGAYYAKNNECPSLHVVSIKFLSGILEKLGDPNWVIASSAVITAIFTAILGVFTVTLARVGRRQIEDTRILQRAYLGASPRGLHEMSDGSVIAHVAIFNSGNLPARKIRNEVRMDASYEGDRADFEEIEITELATLQILPKGEIERGTEALTGPGVTMHKYGLGFIYVWGRVEYDDGFGDKPRWLIYCHRYNCAKPDVLRVHHHHNDGN